MQGNFSYHNPTIKRNGIYVQVVTILMAYGAYRLYDLPVREWLKKKLFKAAIKREESDARINSSEREQARPEVKPAAK